MHLLALVSGISVTDGGEENLLINLVLAPDIEKYSDPALRWIKVRFVDSGFEIEMGEKDKFGSGICHT
jgi:hypothetical protein